MNGFKMSEQQTQILNAISENNSDIRVTARAGCGKTTTILAGCGVATGKVAFLAFNRSIANELSEKAPASVKVQTLHGLGFSILKYNGIVTNDCKPDADKVYNILKAMVQPNERDLIAPAKKLISLVKNNLTDTSEEILWDLAMTYQVDIPDNGAWHKICMMVKEGINQSIPRGQTNAIDFDDMIWLPCVMDVKSFPQYDFVFLDESQDVNATQMKLVLNVCKKGRMVFVGDPCQAIYAFRGADSKAMDTMTETLESMGRKVRDFPLNMTRRCPKKIVELAQRYVPDFTATPDAPEGIVRYTSQMNAKPGDMVLCRVNAPLVPLAYSLIREGVPVKIQGRDIGSGLINTIKKLNPISLDDLMLKVSVYQARETEKINKMYADKPSKIESATINLNDKCDTIRMLSVNQTTVEGIIEAIERIFGDLASSHGVVLLSSIHKAKGLEAPVVWWIQCKEFKGEQENNLKYVAITRAKQELVIVPMPNQTD